MRKRKPTKTAPLMRRESYIPDNTSAVDLLETELSRLTHKFMALPRANVIKVMLEQAESLCQLAIENGEDLSAIEGLL
jgi:hypothetical protein